MNIKYFKIVSLFAVLTIFLNGCATQPYSKSKSKGFKHNEPLIKEDIRKTGKASIEKTVDMGPQPVLGDTKSLQKRKKISSQQKRNYLLIPDEFASLKQNVSFKFKNLDYSEAMQLMGKVGGINILVGDEVAGSITADLKNVPWDKAFNALLDMKNYAADIDVSSNLIRVHSPSTLTAQENYKSTRAAAVKKKVELEDSVEPIVSEIFRLYYISPEQAKTTITELFTSSGDSSFSPIQITEEVTTRSIIVRGKSEDLDVVDKIIGEIDVRTKQVLIEAFIVEADSEFERALGTRLGGAYQKNQESIGGIAGATSTANSRIGTSSAQIGGTADSITDFTTNAAGATSGIGILKRTGSAVLKAEIQALESIGLGKTISNPKVFTLDNQVATITQGEEIQFQATGSEGANTSFKEAALKLTVTPSIIGDGNVLLDVQVNNDSVNRAVSGEPGINKMEIATKLLIADGDIVVIGGIKKNKVFDSKEQLPGIGNVPVLGNLFKGTKKSDSLDELLIFIAPRVL